MAIIRTDTGIALSNTNLPVAVSNPLQPVNSTWVTEEGLLNWGLEETIGDWLAEEDTSNITDPVTAEITAANFPSAVSVFPVNRASIIDGTDETDSFNLDVISGLSRPLAASNPLLNVSEGTVRYSGSGPNWVFNFLETNAQVKAKLDSTSAMSPIVFVVSGKWVGTGEEFGQSMGYGDWQGGNSGDYIWSGKGGAIPPDTPISARDLVGEFRIAAEIDEARYVGGYPQSVEEPNDVWSSTLVIVDPIKREMRYAYVADAPEAGVVRTFTITDVDITRAFEFLTVGTNITLHQMKMSFMGLFYPDRAPNAQEAVEIVQYHKAQHQAVNKVLHPWFFLRDKYGA